MTNTVKIQSQILRNEVTNFSGGQISFDANGQADVNAEYATNLLSVPDFTLVNESDVELVESTDKQEVLRKQPLSMYGKNVIVQLKKGTEEFINLSNQLNTIGDSQYKFDADGVAMMNASAAQMLQSVFPNIIVSSVDALDPEEEVVPPGIIEVTGHINPKVEFTPLEDDTTETTSPTEDDDDDTTETTSPTEDDDDDTTETVVENKTETPKGSPKNKGGRPKRQN